jgi:hypothetical protein
VAEIILRGTHMYMFLFCCLRFLRRGAGMIGISDLLVVVLIADAAQNGMSSDYKSVAMGRCANGPSNTKDLLDSKSVVHDSLILALFLGRRFLRLCLSLSLSRGMQTSSETSEVGDFCLSFSQRQAESGRLCAHRGALTGTAPLGIFFGTQLAKWGAMVEPGRDAAHDRVGRSHKG